MCDLKATQMNVQYTVIQEFMFHKFKLGHNTVKATENICCVKCKGRVDHSTVTRGFKELC